MNFQSFRNISKSQTLRVAASQAPRRGKIPVTDVSAFPRLRGAAPCCRGAASAIYGFSASFSHESPTDHNRNTTTFIPDYIHAIPDYFNRSISSFTRRISDSHDYPQILSNLIFLKSNQNEFLTRTHLD